MKYYIEIRENKIINKGITGTDVELNGWQTEIEEEVYNSIQLPSTFETDAEGNLIDIIPTERPVIPPTKEEINQQVVAKIREVYSIDDEFQMQRLGLQDSNNPEYQAYIQYINECIAWGNSEKAKYGY